MRTRRWLLLAIIGTAVASTASAQFTDEELATWPEMEEFLRVAEVTEERQMDSSEGVTLPYRLTLSHNGVQHDALWKNPSGRMSGYIEGWKYEIAAYELDKHLGLNMVPPTVERRFRKNLGSIQLWVDVMMSGRDKLADKVPVPSIKIGNWNKRTYLQRAFDNLIANEDRHMGNVLITEDWRMLLIDHSRSFRTAKRYTKKLQYDEKSKKPMKSLPRSFVEKLEAMTPESVKEVVGDALNDLEIETMLARRDLLLAEVDRMIGESSEARVLYD